MFDRTKLSKFLAYILRHNPSAVGITLDEFGWAKVNELILGVQKTGRNIDIKILEEIVATDDKRRCAFNEDKSKIRACQGHSFPVDLELEERVPPEFLYHGTAEKYLKSITSQGIEKRSRNFVHLSKDEITAINVGRRHGKPVVLKIDAGRMYENGYKFYLSVNGVWLTEFVPFEYCTEIDKE